ncbi:MAG TPA: trehalase family glycosidase, partial [bacterium]|nr:trehalase family glycosidase [bacterium]
CSDLIVLKNPCASVIFVEKDVVFGRYDSDFPASICSKTGMIEYDDNSIICSSKEGISAFILGKDKNTFSFSYDSASKEYAIQKAKRVLKEKNIECEIKKKMQFFEKNSPFQFQDDTEEKTYLKAISAMKVNCESQQGKINSIWTTPDRWPHKDMWFWDSAFHTLGNRYISYELAEKTIAAVLNCQREDGFISITMNPEKGRVFENITQPPLFAFMSLDLFKITENIDFLEFVYKAISRYIEWLYKNRDNDNDGLLEWLIDEHQISKCSESGMDNSPRFDGVNPEEYVAAIDLNCFAVNEMKCLSEISRILQINNESERWQKLAEEKTLLINRHLWDKNDTFYYDRKQDGSFIRVKTPASFLPLFAGIADRFKAARLIEKLTDPKMFWTEMPIPSVSKDEQTFCKDMWRGGTWLNYNFLVYMGLKKYGFDDIAEKLLIKTKKAVEKWYMEKGSIFEFYDPDNNVSPRHLPRKQWLGTRGWTKAITDFHWSAAIYVVFVNEIRNRK